MAGEVDLAFGDLFATTLGRTVPLASAEELVVDACPLDFIDHRGLGVDEPARAHGRTVLLSGSSPTTARAAGLLRLASLRAEARGS